MLTRVKVGEWTRAGISSPRARPRTNCVLPAPRPPHRPMTSPLSGARPQLSPRASGSAELCEVSVGLGGERPDSVLVLDGDALTRCDFPDATQGKIRELFLPSIQQRHGAAAGDGEKKLEVFAVRESGQQRRFSAGPGFGRAFGLDADGNG